MKELRELSVPELESKLLGLKKELLEVRFKRAAKQLKNPLELRRLKREIARILTVLNEGKVKGGSQR